jgi:hypothetical protein
VSNIGRKNFYLDFTVEMSMKYVVDMFRKDEGWRYSDDPSGPTGGETGDPFPSPVSTP